MRKQGDGHSESLKDIDQGCIPARFITLQIFCKVYITHSVLLVCYFAKFLQSLFFSLSACLFTA